MPPKKLKPKAAEGQQANLPVNRTGAAKTGGSTGTKPIPQVLMTEVSMTAKLQGFLVARSIETGMLLYEVASTILESTLEAQKVLLDAKATSPNPGFDEAAPCPTPAKFLRVPTTVALHQKLVRLASQSQLSRGGLAAELLANTKPTALGPVIHATETLHRQRTVDENEPWSPTVEPFLS